MIDWATTTDHGRGALLDPVPSRSPRPQRVLVADNNRLVAEALMFTLDSDPRVEAIGYALDGWNALELISSLEPDAVIVGTALPGLDPLQLTRWLREAFPGVLPILLRERLVPQEIEELYAAGAADCITTTSSADELLHALSSARKRQILAEGVAALRIVRPGGLDG